MAKQLIIKAKKRENKKPNALRASGYIPATVYGHDFESQSVQVNEKEFLKIPHKAYSNINQLVLDEEKHDVLIRDVQIDPVRDNYLNIQFYKIRSDEKIKVKVPLNYVGHSEAVIIGGVLIVSLNEIEIQCFPRDIPEAIEVNLEEIKEIGQSIQVKDLKVKEGISIIAKPSEVLVKVEVAKTHEIEEAAPTVLPGEVPAEGAAPSEGAQAAAPAGTKETPQAVSKSSETKPAKGKEK